MSGGVRGGVALGRGPAAVLATLIGNGSVTRPRTDSCAARGVDTVLHFAYRDMNDVNVLVVTDGCPEQFAFVNGEDRSVDHNLADFITGATLEAMSGGNVPDLFGDSISEAEATAQAARLSVTFGGEEIDDRVPAGRVLLQFPPPGGGALGDQVDILLSAHTEPACAVAQLVADFRGGGPGADNEFATIELRDTAVRPCLLVGPAEIVGVDADGRPVTQTVKVVVAPSVVLSGHGAAVAVGGEPPLGEVVGDVMFSAEYRDDPVIPDDTLCSAGRVIPSQWRLTLRAGVMEAANTGPDPDGPEFSSLLTCRGELNRPASIAAE